MNKVLGLILLLSLLGCSSTTNEKGTQFREGIAKPNEFWGQIV